MARRMSVTDDYNPLLITVSGPAIESECETGKKCPFTIHNAPHRRGLDCLMSGTAKLDVMDFGDEEDGRLHYYFIPLKPGEYKLRIKWKGRDVTGSPFKVMAGGETIEAEKFVAKVKLTGRVSEGKSNAWNQFRIDCSDMGKVIGALKVHIKGPPRTSAQIDIVDNGDNLYTVNYKPTLPGLYNLTVRIADVHVPGSPFHLRVTEFLSK